MNLKVVAEEEPRFWNPATAKQEVSEKMEEREREREREG